MIHPLLQVFVAGVFLGGLGLLVIGIAQLFRK